VVVRPSSKGLAHIVITWKMWDGVYPTIGTTRQS
jgi:hypothetical protein